MKKILLLMLSICIGFLAYSQDRSQIPKELRNLSKVREYKNPTDPTPPMENIYIAPSPVYKDARVFYDETEIIETVYDLQTNTMLGNRFWVHSDGTMGAVCTRGFEDPNFPDRGTGYNYFDGTQWGPIPSERIEDIRCGWPSYAAWGPTGEIVVSHNGVTGLEISKREVKGTGEWTQTNYQGPAGIENDPTWPRMTTNGENNEYIHIFYNSYVEYAGQSQALLYTRSMDGGETWFPQDIILEGMGEDYYSGISADDYVLASRGDVVALLIASPFKDMFIMKSTNNGEDWEKILIWEHPYPFWDFTTTFTTDTLWSPDNSGAIAIDANGMCHVVWGVGRVARLIYDPPDPGYYQYWAYTDGIGYWNEAMDEIEPLSNPHRTLSSENLEEEGMLIGWAQDINGNGTIDIDEYDLMTYRELGLSTMPSITIDDNGIIALAYASVNEDAYNIVTYFYYKRVWVRTSPDLGYTWGDFYDVTEDDFYDYDECIYPLFAKNSTVTDFHLIFNADFYPGLYLDEDHDPYLNRVIHSSLLKDEIVSVNDPDLVNLSDITVSQNYPNPFSGTSVVTVELTESSNLSIEVFNLMGQKVYIYNAGIVGSGVHKLTIDGSNLQSGVFFYTVKADENSVTRKMIVN